jgi:peptidoglycan/xylan/chitin deacetylase (PgdA/CDA1 family)
MKTRITFDDGNYSDVSHALPELAARGMTARFFVVAGRLGEAGFLSRADVRELARSGMKIGCHGMEHRSWRGMTSAEVRRELHIARAVIEDASQTEVLSAACPFGDYDRRVLRHLRAAGYTAVFTSDGGIARSGAWLQPRTTIRFDMVKSIAEICTRNGSKVSRAGTKIRIAYKRWR